MGINICVVDRSTGKEVPDVKWDWIRMVGDREFVREVLVDEAVTLEISDETTWYYRPIDVEAWRAWDLAQPLNNGRWASLADLLVGDENLWIYVSY